MKDPVKSVREHVEDCLDAIKRLDKQIFAWKEVFEDSALEQAERLDQDTRPLPLKGLVVGLKDIFEFSGRAPGSGTSASPFRTPTQDAAIVKQFKDAGAVIIGLTNLTELCWTRACDTRNPHNLEHTPGGSSSGTAAAVAAGMVPFAIGSQTKGSTIRPASFCGVYGFKPTVGALNSIGMTHISRTLDHPGFFSRQPEELSRVFEVLSRYESTYGKSFAAGVKEKAASSVRIGRLDISGISSMSTEMAEAYENYTQLLQSEGYQVKPIPLPKWFDEVESLFESIFHPEVNHLLSYIIERGEGDKIGTEIRGAIEKGADVSLRSYLEAMSRRDELANELNQLFGDCDLMILPSTLGAAPAGLQYTGNAYMTTFTSVSGFPAVSVPFGVNSNRLPLGIQVISRKYHDRELLSAVNRLPANLVHPKLYP